MTQLKRTIQHRIILITGGSRSGKSAFAQKVAEGIPGRRVYLATCPITDNEIAERIARHKKFREGKGWQTVEEPLALEAAIRHCSSNTILLVDCLTLWVNNLLYQANRRNELLSEDDITRQCNALTSTCRSHLNVAILVTNEVGMGIVPASANSRHYRDLVGRCNQCIAAEADKVVFMVAGIPMVVKENK